MDDAMLARRAVSGDLDSFGQLYDAYFNRVYDFCWRILRDADEAADATQEVFARAMQNLGGLTRATSFKSWLFSIAHNTAVTSAERADRTVPAPAAAHDEAFGAFDVPDPARIDQPEVIAQDHELASLVWEAAAALNPRDYALLDLHVRQGLESAEISDVMGVSRGNASAMVSRMKQAAGDVFTSYVVARRGTDDCDELHRLLAPHTLPPFSDELRRLVDQHIDTCAICQETKRALINPVALFGSFAVVPAPLTLKTDVWRELSARWPHREPATAGAGNGGTSYPAFATAGAGAAAAGGTIGPPLPPTSPAFEDGEGGNRIVLFAVAALGMLLLAFFIAGAAILAGNLGGDGDEGAAGDETPEATASPEGTPGDETPSVIVETNTPGPTDTPAPTDTPTDTPTPAPDTPTPEPTEPPPPPPTSTPEPAGPSPTPDGPGGAPRFPTATPSGN